MQKANRLFALTVILSTTPFLSAERAGTNPHPPTIVSQASSFIHGLTYTALSYFGL